MTFKSAGRSQDNKLVIRAFFSKSKFYVDFYIVESGELGSVLKEKVGISFC
jgi:hypothetical protein